MSIAAYLGTSAFAAAVLERLAADPRTRPALVVSRPDAPAGRGRRLRPPPVAETARSLGIELHQPERVSDDERTLRAARGDGDTVLCAYGAIVKPPLLDATTILNVHPSLLPRWRGAAPIERAMLAGDAETGVSIMELVAALDAGDVHAAAREPIEDDDTYATLAARLQAVSVELLRHVLDERPAPVPQPVQGVTYAEKLEAGDRELDGEVEDAMALDRRVRALTPHVGARLRIGDGWLGVRAARVLEATSPPDPGSLVQRDGRLVLGARHDTALEFLEVQPAGGKPMAGEDFVRGRNVSSG